MVFSSTTFLFLFLPVLLGLYFLVPRGWRNLLLIGASVLFYAWGAGGFVLIMLASTLVDWFLAGRIQQARDGGSLRRARRYLLLSIAQNLAVLGYFKYAGFLVDQVTSLLHATGAGEHRILAIALPIGVSFFTFEKISYTVDVYRGDVAARRDPRDVLLFVSLFPRAIAGPIVRLREVQHDLKRRDIVLDDVVAGATRFTYGLAKKVIVADTVAPVADAAFATSSHDLTTTGAWLGAIAFTLQIYFDFSGYSDMAIGLAQVFGFHLPENFNRPYSAVSVTDFWRRWHMTLSRWFRDYVYIPLGGSRASQPRVYANLVATFLLTGFWHGAQWTFILWGAYHGTLLLLERLLGQRPVGDAPVARVVVRRAVTLLLVMVGWVIFRADSFAGTLRYVGRMFSPNGWSIGPGVDVTMTHEVMLIGALALVIFLLPRRFVLGRYLASQGTAPALTFARLAAAGALFPLALGFVVAGTFHPFLYFRF